jgi:predicted nucleic acid-binding protein
VRDPNDDMIVACAVKGRAQYVVTRDKDLLSMHSYQGVIMSSPEAFRMLLRTGPPAL